MTVERNVPRWVLVRLLGVPVTVTAQSWLFVPPKLAIGVLFGWLTRMQEPPAAWLAWGLLYGVLLLAVLPLHLLGHVLSSRLVLPRMSEAHITPVLIQTLYRDDPADVPGRVHLVRSLGGPLLNVLAGSLSLLWWLAAQSDVVLIFAIANYAIGFGALLPLPTIDGGVIWREVARALRR